MKKIISISSITFFVAIVLNNNIYAQGCIAIRSTGAGNTIHKPDSAYGWILNINNRYFKSYKHYVGTEEQKYRIDSGTNVINHQYALDLALTKEINRYWSVMIDIPILANSRSSLYEHTDPVTKHFVGRYCTHSYGVGDIRFAAYRWLLDPNKHSRGNIQVGLGVKLPTGDYKYQDWFHTSDSSMTLGPVDQSIQLGDGGTGFTTEVNAFYNLNFNLSLYGNFYYLFSPREQNGVSTARGGAVSPMAVKYHTDVMSVPDQYLFRAGANYMVNRFTASAGVRYERLPAKDVIGGDQGFRRPGYIFSFEPGVDYMFKKVTVYAYVPVAIVRNRIQSVSDIQRSIDTGTHIQGDAAFSDYSVNIGATIPF
jgi:hypothetical protein